MKTVTWYDLSETRVKLIRIQEGEFYLELESAIDHQTNQAGRP